MLERFAMLARLVNSAYLILIVTACVAFASVVLSVSFAVSATFFRVAFGLP